MEDNVMRHNESAEASQGSGGDDSAEASQGSNGDYSPEASQGSDGVATSSADGSPLNSIESENAGERLYLRSFELREKLKKQQELPPDHCTFRPNINKNSLLLQKAATPEGKTRFNKLYESAHQIAQKREELRTRTPPNPEYSFKPTITNKGQQKVTKAGSRHDSLYRDAAALRKKRESLRQKKATEQQQKATEGCTFSPQINPSKPRMRVAKTTLYDAKFTQKRLEERARKKLELDLKECTFQPKISSSPAKSSLAFYDRLSPVKSFDAGKKQRENTQRKRQEKKKDDLSDTFGPSITEISFSKDFEEFCLDQLNDADKSPVGQGEQSLTGNDCNQLSNDADKPSARQGEELLTGNDCNQLSNND
eukprot:CAMPEP_0172518466 /NCGR_PEP_ID=MMETSP1066-20121228/290839_1 /TAXON_ID=671091 /ORGANISM="Coscinodiscus wailesii, Strain CCMP2513" /LENGTH=365 /DNA_ID=CAMNT_0013300869 /DNA_START=239 /DNA_END=1336 /DNA_ORIENTATION=-